MEKDDAIVTLGLILCLAVAIIGLYLGSGLGSGRDQARPAYTGQVLYLD